MRCAGSNDSHRLRTSTCPSEGFGIDASFQRNSSPVILLAGRAFKIHWRFLPSAIACPPYCWRASSPSRPAEHGSRTFGGLIGRDTLLSGLSLLRDKGEPLALEEKTL